MSNYQWNGKVSDFTPKGANRGQYPLKLQPLWNIVKNKTQKAGLALLELIKINEILVLFSLYLLLRLL